MSRQEPSLQRWGQKRKKLRSLVQESAHDETRREPRLSHSWQPPSKRAIKRLASFSLEYKGGHAGWLHALLSLPMPQTEMPISDRHRPANQAAEEGNKDEAQQSLTHAFKCLDKAAKHNTIHANTASRRKSRVAGAVARLEKQQGSN